MKWLDEIMAADVFAFIIAITILGWVFYYFRDWL